MTASLKLIVAMTVALAGTAGAQTVTDTTRDAANAVGRAASAAVTPGDQNLGRNPENRSGGLMGSDRTGTSATSAAGRAASAAVTPGDQNMGRTPDNRTGGMMGTDRTATGTGTTGTGTDTGVRRTARADRG